MSVPVAEKAMKVVDELSSNRGEVPKKTAIKVWAYNNAYMLIVLTVFFFITWVILACYGQGWLG